MQRHQFSRGLARALGAALGLLALAALVTPPASAHPLSATSTPMDTYTSAQFGFSIQYPATWQVETSSAGFPAFLPKSQQADCQVDVDVQTQSGTVKDALAASTPAGVSVTQTTLGGLSAIAYNRELLPASAQQHVGQIDAHVDVTLAAQQSSADTVTLFTLTHTLYHAHGTPADADACEATYRAMARSFTFGAVPATHAVATASQTAAMTASTSSPLSAAVNYAEGWWNYNEGNGTSGPYCASVDTSNGEVCTSTTYYGVTQPGGYYQPDFQCAEFVSRALAAAGLLPGLASSSSQGSFGNYTYPKNGKNYNLNYVPSLYSFLSDSGLGSFIGDNPGAASAGDVVIYGSQEHTAIIVLTGSTPMVDSHNTAGQHWYYNSFGMTPNIFHITASGSTNAMTTPNWIGQNSDSRLEAFRKGNDGALWHDWQTCATCGWNGWSSLGAPSSTVMVNDPPVVIRDFQNYLEVFVRGSDGAIWHIGQSSSGWSGWASLGGQWGGPPTVAINGLHGLEVFVVGRDGALWHTWQTQAGGGWSSWSSLQGSLGGDPIVTHNNAGNIEVFVRGLDSALWHIWQNCAGCSWSSWSSLGGALGDTPAIAHNSDGRMEVFAENTSGTGMSHIWQTCPTCGWSSWGSLGGSVTGVPTVVLNPVGALEVFMRGTDGSMQHIWQTSSGWSSWGSLGGSLGSDPAATMNHTNNTEVFARFTDSTIDHLWQNGGGGQWTGWSSLGGSFSS